MDALDIVLDRQGGTPEAPRDHTAVAFAMGTTNAGASDFIPPIKPGHSIRWVCSTRNSIAVFRILGLNCKQTPA